VIDRESTPEFPWDSRWTHLARGAGLHGHEPVLVALSGGADSVFLLHLLARAVRRPRILAVHVNHGLRGDESDSDAAFCARLCARLGVPFACREVPLEPGASNLEATAREARYHALFDEAVAAGIATILTGHHEDDALETLLMRWMRGTALPGLAGLKRRNPLTGATPGELPRIEVVRPLLSMRREEVRLLLRQHDIAWREDSSNESERFTRNRVRHGLLPQIAATCGERGVENLRAFASAVEGLEEELAARTAHLAWEPPVFAAARRTSDDAHVGGTLSRAKLTELADTLQRRALWRLLSEGTGYAPTRSVIETLQSDLKTGRTTRRSLPGDWSLQLRSDALHLTPPGRSTREPKIAADGQLPFPFAGSDTQPALRLAVPGATRLGDGRSLHAEWVEVSPARPVPRSSVEVELDASRLSGPLSVRWARPGDRFHALGAPGSRPLRRFLADAGIPREERALVPLVFCGDELIWVAGVRPCEPHRVRATTTRRLGLKLEGAAPVRVPTQAPGGLFETTAQARG